MQQSVFYRLLLAPQFRLLRYIILAILLLLFSFSETHYNFDIPRYGVFPFLLLSICGAMCKFAPIFFLMQYVVLRLLPRQKYMIFWGTIVGVIVAFIFIQYGIEYIVCHYYNMPYARLPQGRIIFFLLDFAVQAVQWFLVFMALSMGYLLKYWMETREREQEVEMSHLQLETELIKESVSPEVLCETIHQSGLNAAIHPDEVSQRLILLSRLLRYQLYDSRRHEVLLDSEVKFLGDYLMLLKLNGSCDDFSLNVEGKSMGIFIQPQIFIQFVKPSKSRIDMSFEISDNSIIFRIMSDSRKIDNDKLQHILEAAYPQQYCLNHTPGSIVLTLNRMKL